MTIDGGKRNVAYQPPFVYFGGKSSVADVVWQALGADVPNYIEPFCGSAAVLFLRPGGAGHTETINDADGLLSNFWRAVKLNVEAVAEWADDQVNEAELHAKHLWLLGQRERLTEKLMADPEWHDARAAGYWAWGLNCWIGGGWCSGKGPWQAVDGVFANTRAKEDGVNRKRPHLGNAGQGVKRQLPHLGTTGLGVNRKRPHLGDPGKGECAARREWLTGYLQTFADRLRNVRVCCGDWRRVCGPSVTFKHGITGVFLDPPYADTAGRADDIYAVDCQQVAHRVREWAIEQGQNPLMRICLAGYQDEHQMPDDWRVHKWTTAGGYGCRGDDEDKAGRANSKRERLWFSPACLGLTKNPQMSLFPKESR